MNKQAYERLMGAVLAAKGMIKVAEDKPIRAITKAPATATSSLISSTPSSLVSDAISLPGNISSAVSASSGKGPGDVKWIMNKNLMGKTPAAISMLFPKTTGLYYSMFGDMRKLPEGLEAGAKEIRKKYGPRVAGIEKDLSNYKSMPASIALDQ